MRSKASVGGHPIHPMIIPFPIVLFFAALLFDLVHAWRKSDFWYKLSSWNLILGLVGGASAAIPGVIDYFTSLNISARRPTVFHALLNIAAIIVGALNLVLRLYGRASTGPRRSYTMLLSAFSAALLTLSGWFGGEIVYRHGVAVEPAPPHRYRIASQGSDKEAAHEAA